METPKSLQITTNPMKSPLNHQNILYKTLFQPMFSLVDPGDASLVAIAGRTENLLGIGRRLAFEERTPGPGRRKDIE